MAKDKLDPPDLDKEFGGSGDFGFDGFEDNRKPITKMKDAAIESAMDELKSPSFYSSVLRKSLPDEYGSAADSASSVIDGANSIYNTAVKEFAPTAKELKKGLKSVLPKESKLLPKRFLDWAHSTDSEDVSQTSRDNMEMNIALGDIFKTSIVQQAQMHHANAQSDTKRDMKDGKRHLANMQGLANIGTGIGRLIAYNDEVNFKFQRKSLELQYKLYYVTRDILNQAKLSFSEHGKQLAAIAKNTGLPDAIKMTHEELVKYVMKQKIAGAFTDNIARNFNDLVRRVTENGAKMMKEKIASASMPIQMISSMLPMMGMMGGPMAMIAGSLGAGAIGLGGNKIAGLLGNHLGSNKHIAALGKHLAGLQYNAPGMISDWANNRLKLKDKTKDTDGNKLNKILAAHKKGGITAAYGAIEGEGFLGKLKNLIVGGLDNGKDLTAELLGKQKNSISFGKSIYHRANDPAQFNVRGLHSITDVIPGLLSRILREQTIARTGDVNTPLIGYNLKSNKFQSTKVKGTEFKSDLKGSEGRKYTRDNLDSLVGKVDKKGALSDSAREALKFQMLANSSSGSGNWFNPDALSDTSSYHSSISDKDKKELAVFFTNTFETDRNHEWTDAPEVKTLIAESSEAYSRVYSYMPKVIDDIQYNIMNGNADEMEELGLIKLVKDEWVLDQDGLLRFILSEAKADVVAGKEAPKPLDKNKAKAEAKARNSAVPGATSISPDAPNKNSKVGKAAVASGFKQHVFNEKMVKIQVKGKGFLKDAQAKANGLAASFNSGKNIKEGVVNVVDDLLDDVNKLVDSNTYTKQAKKEIIDRYKKVMSDPRVVQASASTKAKLAELQQAIEGNPHFQSAKLYGAEKLDAFKKTKVGSKLTSWFNTASDYMSNNNVKDIIKDIKNNDYKALYARYQEAVVNHDYKGDYESYVAKLKANPEFVKLTAQYEELKDSARDTKDSIMKAGSSKLATLQAKMSESKAGEDWHSAGADKDEWHKQMLTLTSEMKTLQEDMVTQLHQGLIVASGDGTGGRRLGLRYGLRSFIGKSLSGMGSAVKGFGSFIGGNLKAGGSLAATAGKFVSRAAGGALDYFTRKRFPDIYVSGEDSPRLTYTNVAKGMYTDKETGKVIKKLSDINGEVITSGENPTVVISKEDYAKGLNDVYGKSILRKVASKMVDLGLSMLNPGIALGKMAASAINGVRKYVTRPRDVYLVGNLTTPILYASTFEAGGYSSERTGKVLKNQNQIDGAVVQWVLNEKTKGHDKVVRLTDEQFHNPGICDYRGKKFSTFGTKVIRAVMKAGRFVGGVAKGILKFGWGVTKGLVTGAWKAVKAIGKFALRGIGGKMPGDEKSWDFTFKSESVILLKSIRDILDARLPDNGGGGSSGEEAPVGTKKGFNDYLTSAKETARGYGNRLKSKYNDLKDKMFNRNKVAEAEPETATVAEETAAKRVMPGGFGRKRKGGQNAGGKSIKGKVIEKPGIGKASTLAEGAKVAEGATSAVGAATEAGAVAGVVSKLGMVARVGGVLAMAGEGIMAAGAAIAGLISLPVILGAAAIAGVAYIGWKMYKSGGPKDIVNIRMMQYGFNPKDSANEEHISKILQAEEMLMSGVTYQGDQASIKFDQKKVRNLLDLFGISQTDPDGIKTWGEWFLKRFKPVFLRFCAAAKEINSDVGLMWIDRKFKPEEKIKLLTKITGNLDAYNVMDSPFKNTKITVDSGDIQSAIKEATDKIKQDVKNPDDKSNTANDIGSGIMAGFAKGGIAGAVVGGTLAAGKALLNNSIGSGILSGFAKGGLAGAVVGGTVALAKAAGKALTVGADVSKESGGPLTNLRFKAYGLKTMDLSKMSTLRQLERVIFSELTFNGNGEAIWSGDPSMALAVNGASFGVGENSDDQQNWTKWFQKRFLPVIMTYASAVHKLNGNIDLKDADTKLKPADQLSVAQAIMATKAPSWFFFGSSIWGVSDSPWPGYELNSDSKTTAGNLELIKTMIGKPQLATDQNTSVTAKGNVNTNTNKDGTKPNAAAKGGWFDNLKSTVQDAFVSKPSTAPSAPKPAVTTTAGTGMGTVSNVSTSKVSGGDVMMPTDGVISSPFGMRTYAGQTKMHKGIDIAAPAGTPVKAAMDGVIIVREVQQGYGNVIYIQHANGMSTRYGHLQGFAPGLSVGSQVVKGQVIGFVGNTGISRGNHLHFEIRKSPNDPIDPLTMLTKSATARDAVQNLKETQDAIDQDAKDDLSIKKPEDNIEGVSTLAPSKGAAPAPAPAAGTPPPPPATTIKDASAPLDNLPPTTPAPYKQGSTEQLFNQQVSNSVQSNGIKDKAADFAGLTKVMQQQLEVQRAMSTSLVNIEGILGKYGLKASTPSGPAQQEKTSEYKPGPVSMDKRNVP